VDVLLACCLLLLRGRVLRLFDCFAYDCVYVMYACDALISEYCMVGCCGQLMELSHGM
jgi:hypothetical protein